MELKMDLTADGMPMLFRDYQEFALRFVWESEEGVTSREVYEDVNTRLNGGTISRASIINFLKAMAQHGVLDYTEKTGKGGYHRVYSPRMSEHELWVSVKETTDLKLAKMLGY